MHSIEIERPWYGAGIPLYQFVRIPVEWSSTVLFQIAWKWWIWRRNDTKWKRTVRIQRPLRGRIRSNRSHICSPRVIACLSTFERLAAQICLLRCANSLALHGLADSLFAHSFAPMLTGKKHESINGIQCYHVPISLVRRNKRKLSLKPGKGLY